MADLSRLNFGHVVNLTSEWTLYWKLWLLFIVSTCWLVLCEIQVLNYFDFGVSWTEDNLLESFCFFVYWNSILIWHLSFSLPQKAVSIAHNFCSSKILSKFILTQTSKVKNDRFLFYVRLKLIYWLLAFSRFHSKPFVMRKNLLEIRTFFRICNFLESNWLLWNFRCVMICVCWCGKSFWWHNCVREA